jgi:hypothetical protein
MINHIERITRAAHPQAQSVVEALEPVLRLLDRATGEGMDICGIDAGDCWNALAEAAGMDDVNDEDHFVSGVLAALQGQATGDRDAVIENIADGLLAGDDEIDGMLHRCERDELIETLRRAHSKGQGS